MKRCPRAVFWAILTLLPMLGLLGLEGLCRLATPFPPGSIGTYRQDPSYFYFHQPQSVGYEISPFHEFPPVRLRYDANGFRGSDRPASDCAVYLLGDSFVEARQVPEGQTMAAILEKTLRCPSGPVQVVNAGCSAYTTTTAYLLLRHLVAPLRPKAVVYFFSFNDYCDNFWYNNYSAVPDILDAPHPEMMPRDYERSARPTSLSAWLSEHSALYALLADFGRMTGLAKPPRLSVWTSLVEAKEFHRNWTLVNKTDLDSAERQVLDFTHQGLLRMAQLAREQGFAFLVAVIPVPMQVDAKQWREGKATVGFSPDQTMDSSAYQDRLLATLAEADIPAVDLLPAFKQAAAGGTALYLNADGHLTPEGQRTAAMALGKSLQALLRP